MIKERRIISHILCIVAAVMVMASFSQARIRGGSITVAPVGPCTHAAAGFADGCAGANQNATFLRANFYTYIRQSGQASYKAAGGADSDHPHPWDQGGIDYPVGNVTPDNSLIDASTNVIPGCSLDKARRYQRCNAGVNTTGYRFNGIGLFVLTKPVILSDVYLTMTATNCLSYSGSGPIAVNGAITGDHSVTQSKFDFAPDCRMNSDLYHTAWDPGLQQQTTIPDLTITTNNPGATVTINNTITGKIRKGQYLDCTGCNTGYVQLGNITSITPKTITGITIAGNIATVTTSVAHGLTQGVGLAMFDQSNVNYQGQVEVIDAPTPTTFRYAVDSTTNPTGPATVMGSYGITYLSGASVVGSTWTVTMSTVADIRGVTITGNVLHYTTRVGTPTVNAGDQVIGAGVAPDTLITGSTTGTNNYLVNISQTISTPVNMNTYKYTPPVANVAGSTGPVQTTINGPLALASGTSKVTLLYNANLGSGQFASAGAAVLAKYNYEEINSQGAQHVNFIFNAPAAGTIDEFRMDFNVMAWLAEAEDGGTGTADLFTASTSSATNGMVTFNEWSVQNNIIIANKSAQTNNYNTNSLIRFLSQGGGVPGNVGTANWTLNAIAGSGIVSITSFTPASGGVGHISTDDFLNCSGSLPLCSVPIRIINQLTGSSGATCPDATCNGLTGTYSTTNTVNALSKTGLGIAKYPGQIVQADVSGNYLDIIGTQGGAYNFDIGNVPVGTLNSVSNIKLTSGNLCNFGGTCI